MKVTKWASDHRDRLELAYLFRYAPRVLEGMNVPKEDGMLATDFEAELPVAHARPDFGFRGRERMPKVARALENRGIDVVGFF